MKEETPGISACFNRTHLLARLDMASSATSRTWPLANDNSYALRTVPYLATEEYNLISNLQAIYGFILQYWSMAVL
jgi:hypothetical protein